MVLGVDFDNTIVCYDALFHRIAVEWGLVPGALPPRKNDVRDYLRQRRQGEAWTKLQGYVYGPRMAEAQPFPGVVEFFQRGVRQGLSLHIISHKTRTAVLGPGYDLQQSARAWLTAQGFFDPVRVGLSPERVHFGATRQEKICYIVESGCTHFIDDLEETFLEESFPAGVVKILYGSRSTLPHLPAVAVAEDWPQLTAALLDGTR